MYRLAFLPRLKIFQFFSLDQNVVLRHFCLGLEYFQPFSKIAYLPKIRIYKLCFLKMFFSCMSSQDNNICSFFIDSKHFPLGCPPRIRILTLSSQIQNIALWHFFLGSVFVFVQKIYIQYMYMKDKMQSLFVTCCILRRNVFRQHLKESILCIKKWGKFINVSYYLS